MHHNPSRNRSFSKMHISGKFENTGFEFSYGGPLQKWWQNDNRMRFTYLSFPQTQISPKWPIIVQHSNFIGVVWPGANTDKLTNTVKTNTVKTAKWKSRLKLTEKVAFLKRPVKNYQEIKPQINVLIAGLSVIWLSYFWRNMILCLEFYLILVLKCFHF